MDLFSRLPHGAGAGLSCPHTEPYIILDTEITGDTITGLCAIKYNTSGEAIGFYQTALNVSGAPTAQHIGRSFLSFLSDCLLVSAALDTTLDALNRTFSNAFVGRKGVEVNAKGWEAIADLLRRDGLTTNPAPAQQEKPAKPARKSGARPVIQCDDEGTVIKEFASAAAAASETGIGASSIRSAANGKQKHAGGFCWKYAD